MFQDSQAQPENKTNIIDVLFILYYHSHSPLNCNSIMASPALTKIFQYNLLSKLFISNVLSSNMNFFLQQQKLHYFVHMYM